jgi:hypothetical protein
MQTIGSSDNPDPLVGRVLLRDLRLVERLGATSEGPLYRGQYAATGPPVAVTLLRMPSGSAAPPGTAFLSDSHWQELQRACQIQHPNVATLLDVGETPDGIVYAVGELLTGELVSDILAVSAGIPPPQAVDISLQVAEGLRAAHAAGVVHGSVSPQTVLVIGGGERLAVKLIRFDLTRHLKGHADPVAAPWADDQLDPTDDIVGLGVLLHCLLTGVPPDGERRVRTIPAPLRRIIDRCLGARGRPYPTVAALADDLTRQAGVEARRRYGIGLRPAALAAGAALLAGALWFGWTRIRADSADARNEVGTGALEAVADSQRPPAGNPVVRRSDSLWASAGRQPTARAPLTDSKAPKSGAPKSGAPKSGAPKSGAPKSGAPKSGAPKGGAAPARARDSAPTGAPDSAAALSPFRRSHPWAAEPSGRVYFRSSCPQALRATDLLYFTTEAEARATGRTRSPDPRCS